MAIGDLCYDLKESNITDPAAAWCYVASVIRKHGRPPDDMYEQVVYAYHALYRTSIVVNGAVIPEVARRFKQAGFPLDSIRSNQGIFQVTVLTEGVTYTLYEDTPELLDRVNRYVATHGKRRWLQRLALWCIRHA